MMVCWESVEYWEKCGMIGDVWFDGRSVVYWKKCIVYWKKCGIMGELW